MQQNKIKVDKKLLKKLKPYWEKLVLMQCEFVGRVSELEDEMSREVGIKNLEFFQCDNEFVGIGNVNKTLKLISSYELERGKTENA
jgi:hypothetical protein